MDIAPCEFLGDDDMFGTGSYTIFHMGFSRVVERYKIRTVRHSYRNGFGSGSLGRPQVDMIYGMKEGENPLILTLLMLFIIGPAEEIFWRGYVQKNLTAKWNPNIGFIVTTLVYSLVHLPKMNFMLIMAAAVAGFIWGLAYRFFPERLGAIILSHALWDCAVFIWFPIG